VLWCNFVHSLGQLAILFSPSGIPMRKILFALSLVIAAPLPAQTYQ